MPMSARKIVLVLVGKIARSRLRARRRSRRPAHARPPHSACTLSSSGLFVEAFLVDVGDVDRAAWRSSGTAASAARILFLEFQRAHRLALVELRAHFARAARASLIASLSPALRGFAGALQPLSRPSPGRRARARCGWSRCRRRVDLPRRAPCCRRRSSAPRCDRVGLADVGEKLVAQSLAFRGAGDETRDVDELDTAGSLSPAWRCRRAPAGADPALRRCHVRLDRAERIVLRRDAGLGQRVEQRGLADVGSPTMPHLSALCSF